MHGPCRCGAMVLCGQCGRPSLTPCDCQPRRGETFRARWRYDGPDAGLRLFGAVLHATPTVDLAAYDRVLEIGCAEADWLTLAQAAEPTLDLYGIDWRRCVRPGTIVQGDVLRADFRPASFDVIVSLSAIEHIGLGHYEADPAWVEGDISTVRLAWHWLKPGGWLYLDVPYTPEGAQVVRSEYRTYDAAALARLLRGEWQQTHLHYADANDADRLLACPSTSPAGRRPYHYVAGWLQKRDPGRPH